jgi:hypothetical protein
MEPELVDLMVELQDLNAFFKEGLEDVDTVVAMIDKEKEKLSPPSLVVSNSEKAVPLLLEGQTASTPPVLLANRRGKKLLSPLRLSQDQTNCPYTEINNSNAIQSDILYPGIPTPFFGSPSSYSPQFEYTKADGVSMPLQDMVSKLRSQCAAIDQQVEHLTKAEDSSGRSFEIPSDILQDHDRSFTDSFLRAANEVSDLFDRSSVLEVARRFFD